MIDPIRISRDLAEIIDISEQLFTQAVNDANATVDGTSLPGGRAMVDLAPVADLVTWQRRGDLAETAWLRTGLNAGVTRIVDGVLVRASDGTRPEIGVDEDDDDHAPVLQLLRFWSDEVRRALESDWDHIRTITTEAKFLRHKDTLDWVLNNEPNVEHFARDINRARTHLETVLSDGRRPDRSRVLCNNPTCDDHRTLIRVYAPRYVVGWVCQCGTQIPERLRCSDCGRGSKPDGRRVCGARTGRKDDPRTCEGALVSTAPAPDHCPNPWCWTPAPPVTVWASNTDHDRWKCTNCKKRYDDQNFLDAHAEQLRDASAEKFVILADAIGTLVAQGRPEVTVRSWLQPPRRHVADRCTVCRRRWPPQEHNVCPGKVKGTLDLCGGELRPVRRGNPDNVIEAYCDVATHRVYVWWPDLWRRHLVTKAAAERRAARQATRTEGESA